jgi:hypothetical protein
MLKAEIHFEQISVEIVKKIATQHPQSSSIGNDGWSCEARDERMSLQEEWRQLAQQVQQEEDPQRLIHLMQQLLDALDEEKRRKSHLRKSQS